MITRVASILICLLLAGHLAWADGGFKQGAREVGGGFKQMGKATGKAFKKMGKDVRKAFKGE